MKTPIIIKRYGYDHESGIWFFADCAFEQNGRQITPDSASLYHDKSGNSYRVKDTLPSAVDCPPRMLRRNGFPMSASQIFNNVATDLYACIGDYSAWMALGITASYAAAPELLKQYGGQPGVWLSGKMASGKTMTGRWLMSFWGFTSSHPGIAIGQRITADGMRRHLDQCSCLPVWFDEYRAAEIDPEKNQVIRGTFDRCGGAYGKKGNSNKCRRIQFFTTPIVTGESRPMDSATRSRYVQITLDKRKWQAGHEKNLKRILKQASHWYLLGRWIMKNRSAFTAELLQLLAAWMSDERVKENYPNERIRFVYGTAFAGFHALAKCLSSEFEQYNDFFNFAMSMNKGA